MSAYKVGDRVVLKLLPTEAMKKHFSPLKEGDRGVISFYESPDRMRVVWDDTKLDKLGLYGAISDLIEFEHIYYKEP